MQQETVVHTSSLNRAAWPHKLAGELPRITGARSIASYAEIMGGSCTTAGPPAGKHQEPNRTLPRVPMATTKDAGQSRRLQASLQLLKTEVKPYTTSQSV